MNDGLVSVGLILERTVEARTASFAAVLQAEHPIRPAAMVSPPTAGVTEFATRRSIVRYLEAPGRVSKRAADDSPPALPVYLLCDGPSMSSARPWGWEEAYPDWEPSLPRQPNELRFLDLLEAGVVVDQRPGGEDRLGDLVVAHYVLTLVCDRNYWPKPTVRPDAQRRAGLMRRMMLRTLSDPRPNGPVHAEVWIDTDQRLRACSWTEGRAVGASNKVLWTTTQLWDFGVPPPIADRTHQAMIDPVTLLPLETWPPTPIARS